MDVEVSFVLLNGALLHQVLSPEALLRMQLKVGIVLALQDIFDSLLLGHLDLRAILLLERVLIFSSVHLLGQFGLLDCTLGRVRFPRLKLTRLISELCLQVLELVFDVLDEHAGRRLGQLRVDRDMLVDVKLARSRIVAKRRVYHFAGV